MNRARSTRGRYVKCIVCEGGKWINVVQNRVQWQDHKNAVVDDRREEPSAPPRCDHHDCQSHCHPNTMTQQWQNAASRGTPKQSFIACPSVIP